MHIYMEVRLRQNTPFELPLLVMRKLSILENILDMMDSVGNRKYGCSKKDPVEQNCRAKSHHLCSIIMSTPVASSCYRMSLDYRMLDNRDSTVLVPQQPLPHNHQTGTLYSQLQESKWFSTVFYLYVDERERERESSVGRSFRSRMRRLSRLLGIVTVYCDFLSLSFRGAGRDGRDLCGSERCKMAASDPEAEQKRIEEIEALSAIYGDEWCAIDEDEKIFCIRVSECLEEPKWTLCLQVILPPEYPTAAPPIYQLNAPWLQGQEYAELANNLEEIYIQNLGESILYLWVEKIREFLIEKSQSCDSGPEVKKSMEEIDVEHEESLLDYLPLQECTTLTVNFDLSERQEGEELPPIYHGNPITDRRSTFQGHLAPVVSPKQVKNVLAELYKNKKIANATHNIYAYRIYCEDKQTFLQDCEDDGETAAGGRLLHLMQILDVHNVLVVVSRWYGGILLGPDRFKHINNCARNILVEKNYTNSAENLSKHSGKNRRVRKDKKKTEH